MCFILRADKICYGYLSEELRKGVYKGRYKYPTTVPDDYKLLMRTSRHLVNIQETAEEVKVLCLHSMADAAEEEDAEMI